MDEMKNDDLGTPLKIVSVCVPVVGLVLYFVKKEQEPNSSKQACNMALIGVGIQVVGYIIFAVLGGLAGALGG